MKYQKISVLIPNYNDSENLEKTIISIIRQKLKPIEILIVDDGSTDNSIQIIKKLKSNFGEIIKFRRNKKNLGIAKSVNQNLKYLIGDFFFLGSANDEIPENFFFDIFDFIPLREDIKAIYGNIKFI